MILLNNDTLPAYFDGGRDLIALPPGHYQFEGPFRHSGIRITSADEKQPAQLAPVLVFGHEVELDNLELVGSGTFTDTAATLRGDGCAVRRCTLGHGFKFGIVAEKRATIEANVLFGFSGDGIQFCGNGTIISRNVIGYLQLQDGDEDAHHDAMQGWAGDPDSPFRHAGRFDACYSLDEVVICNNTLIDVPGSPLQGITFFDGLAKDWTINDNTVLLRGPHPLTVMGLLSGEVERNVLMPGQQVSLPPARQWLAESKQWRSVDELSYFA